LADLRPQLDRGTDSVDSRQAMRDDPERQGDEEQAGDASPDEHRAGNDSSHAQDQERSRRDADDRDEIDDPLDHDRAEGGRPADSFAVAEVVASDQLAETRRED